MANKRRDFSKAYAQDKKDREQSEGGFADRRKYLVPAKVLDDLGVREFSTRLEEKEDSRRIKLHVLEPHPDDPAVFGLKLFVHHNVGEEQAAVICPKRQAAYFHEKKITIPDAIKNARCPICDEAETLVPQYLEIKKSGTQDERDAMWTRMREMRSHGGGYKDIQKPKMYLVWCVDSQDEDAGVQFFMMPGTVYEGMIEQMEAAWWEKVKDARGDHVTVPAGNGDTLYLMQIEQKYYDEDIELQQKRNIDTTATQAQSLGEDEYVPLGRQSVAEREII